MLVKGRDCMVVGGNPECWWNLINNISAFATGDGIKMCIAVGGIAQGKILFTRNDLVLFILFLPQGFQAAVFFYLIFFFFPTIG